MSLAQRRTTLDGIEAISLHSTPSSTTTRTTAPEEEGLVGSSGDGSTDVSTIVNDDHHQHDTDHHHDEGEVLMPQRNDGKTTVPAEDGKEIWQTLSYDPFGAQGGPPELQHYESFPPEFGDNVAAYEVSTAKRVGE